MLVGHRGPDLPDGAGLAGEFVQDIPDRSGDLPDRHAAGGVIADDAEQPGLACCLGFPARRRAVLPAGRREPGKSPGERGDGAAADCGEPPHADRAGGDAWVADVNLQQARAQVVGSCEPPDIGLDGFPGGGPDAHRERRRERPVIRRHALLRGCLPAPPVSDAISTPMESRLARVIFSVLSRTAWMAAPRMRRSRLPIMPPVRRCRYSSSPVRVPGWWRCRRRLSSRAEISPVQYSPRGKAVVRTMPKRPAICSPRVPERSPARSTSMPA